MMPKAMSVSMNEAKVYGTNGLTTVAAVVVAEVLEETLAAALPEEVKYPCLASLSELEKEIEEAGHELVTKLRILPNPVPLEFVA